MKRLLLCSAAFLFVCFLLSGCASLSTDRITSYLTGEEEAEAPTVQQDSPDDTPAAEMAADSVLQDIAALEVLRMAYQEQYGLNPFTTVSLCNRAIMCLLYEPLYQVNAQFQPEPVLAADTQVSDDGLTTTITLQPAVYFHNGQPLTADDVVYSYELAVNSAYYGNRFYHITSVTAPDSRTVCVTTDTAFESVALLLDFPVVSAGTGEAPVPVGTGPFVYDGSYYMEPFSRWWQKQWVIPCGAVELTPCDTSADIRDKFEYGDVNLVWTDPNSAAYASFHNDSESWYCPTTIMQYIGFNTFKKSLSNPGLRASITYAIDRDTIVAKDMGGSALAATLPASPQSACYNTGLAAAYAYDPEQFQARLSELQIQDYTGDGIVDVFYKGDPITLDLTMIVAAGNTQRRLTAARIADSLNWAGFHVTVEVLDEEKFLQALRYGNYDLYYGEIRLSSNFDLGSFFRPKGAAAYGGLESNTALSLCDNLLENSGNAYDLHKRIMDQGYLCPILFKSYTVYTTRGAAQDLNPALDWVIH